MTKKQEKIKEAYGQYWESGNIDENGWTNSVSQGFLHEIPCDGKEMHIVYGHPEWWYRPKSLAGLEDNNGWISISNESDFPTKDDCGYFILKNGKPEYWYWPKREALNSAAWLSVITHWQKIETHKPPIY